jgi:FAD dependent monooxygenase
MDENIADENRLGYICGICERKVFLRSMFEQLKNKSKVLTSKKVMSIHHAEEQVVVKCEDGSEFTGDIVIGADGIHSKTRQEMHRYADETGPPGLMERDKTCRFLPLRGASHLVAS